MRFESTNNTHWSKGGTGITNLSDDVVDDMATALRQINDNDLFIKHARLRGPLKGPYKGIDLGASYSLHDRKRRPMLSELWKAFYHIRPDLSGDVNSV